MRSHRYLPLLAMLAFTATLAPQTQAQDGGVEVRLAVPDRIRVSERSNLSTREDGRYAGLLSRQVTGYLTRSQTDAYHGRFYLFEQVRRDMQQVARPVDRSIEAGLEITPTTLFAGSGPYPSLAHLLDLPPTPIPPGFGWSAPAWITIDPRRAGEPLRLPVVISYRFVGREPWNGASALRIDAQFATRYPLPPSDDPDAPVVEYDGAIASVNGAHRLTIMLPAPELDRTGGSGQIAFLRDEITEQYRFHDRTELVHQGHSLLFLSGLTLDARQRIAETVRDRLDEQPLSEVTVDETDTGVRLTVDALRFLPDQAVLLPEERGRLDTVAAALRSVENTRFLVVGHTADVGTQESQLLLSTQRARTIAAALAERGISPDRIDVEGRGGTEPVATNADEAGRARNRRVEIYLLEE